MVNNAKQPFYSLSLIKALVNENHFSVVNPRANNRIEDLGWDASILKGFILALNDSHFVARYPQCSYANFLIDCDGYKMRYDEGQCVEDKDSDLEIFIKLADLEHRRTLIISFHLEGSIG